MKENGIYTFNKANSLIQSSKTLTSLFHSLKRDLLKSDSSAKGKGDQVKLNHNRAAELTRPRTNDLLPLICTTSQSESPTPAALDQRIKGPGFSSAGDTSNNPCAHCFLILPHFSTSASLLIVYPLLLCARPRAFVLTYAPTNERS